ncbi:hypothetical protein DVH26_13445 [Paenibacillus sp. H1-7]|uniref:hypothetical protein n=1 Tax=Paenibacillus sp. H1-7 TaxID=2282849 RepID=UPI001EF75E8D|nr:hypothetical protein [Paenibacillus sp. H1-7]ULL15353.1 hypothetical protein DVH26_13445 [Paenibacillus sp. H1-7]
MQDVPLHALTLLTLWERTGVESTWQVAHAVPKCVLQYCRHFPKTSGWWADNTVQQADQQITLLTLSEQNGMKD